IVGDAEDGRKALELAHRLKPDVLVLDNSMPEMSGVDVARELSRSHPEITIIVYTSDDTCSRSAIAAGAAAVITKDEPVALLVDSIRTLSKERAAMSTGSALSELGR